MVLYGHEDHVEDDAESDKYFESKIGYESVDVVLELEKTYVTAAALATARAVTVRHVVLLVVCNRRPGSRGQGQRI